MLTIWYETLSLCRLIIVPKIPFGLYINFELCGNLHSKNNGLYLQFIIMVLQHCLFRLLARLKILSVSSFTSSIKHFRKSSNEKLKEYQRCIRLYQRCIRLSTILCMLCKHFSMSCNYYQWMEGKKSWKFRFTIYFTSDKVVLLKANTFIVYTKKVTARNTNN